MKILHVIPSVDPQAGGTVAGLKQLLSQYKTLGVIAEVACCDAPDASWLNSSELPTVHALGPGYRNYSYTSSLIPWLRKNSSRFDAVIIDGIWQFHSLAVHIALTNTNTPYFVFTHGMLGPWFKYNHPLKHLKKWLYWPWAEYWVLRKAKAVLFTCDEERLLARESFWMYRANEAVAGFGTSTPPMINKEAESRLIARFPELTNKRIALFVGRMHPIKGCDVLLESFARVANSDDRLHLMMVGPDHDGQISELQQQVDRLGISNRITWTGMLDGDDKWAAFRICEVFCLPSHHENFGVVVAEALACSKPVLISDKVNIWREINSDSAGFIAQDDAEGMQHNFQRWLNLNADSYKDMAERAHNCFEKRFHIRNAAKELIKIINRNR